VNPRVTGRRGAGAADWDPSLVAFTLLAQGSAGCYLLLLVTAAHAPGSSVLPLAAAMLLALGSSLLHLGDPGKAWRAVTGWRSSWVSREVIFAVLFLSGLAGSGLAGTRLWQAVALMGALGLLVSIAGVYRLRSVPAWDVLAVPVSFTVTALLLGIAGLQCIGSPGDRSCLVAASLAFAQVGLLLAWLRKMRGGPEAAVLSRQRILIRHRAVLRWRVLTAVAGGVMLVISAGNAGLIPLLSYPALGLVVLSEVLGRLLFYRARIREGL
jgi:DMSO reductase anchor subunit